MASIHRALRPGGKVVVIDFHRIEGKSREWVLNHVRAGQEVFTREIVSNGFKLVEEKRFLKENYCLVFEKLENDRRGKGEPEKVKQGTPPAVSEISDRLRQYIAADDANYLQELAWKVYQGEIKDTGQVRIEISSTHL